MQFIREGGSLVVTSADDDGMLLWLSNRSQAAAECAKNYLWNHTATGVTYSGGSRTLQHSGLRQIFAGQESAQYFHVAAADPRHPDVFGISQVGVVYTTGSKIAEHGGANPGDRDVPIVVYAPGVVHPQVYDQSVETTQIAPTVLNLLGLDPNDLQAVQIEGTEVLPGT